MSVHRIHLVFLGLLFGILGACGPQVIYDDALQEEAVRAALAYSSMPLASEAKTVRVVVVPEHGVTSINMPMSGLYKAYDDGTVKFGLLLPQGVSLGSCTGSLAQPKCVGSPLQGSENLVRTSFSAVRSFLMSTRIGAGGTQRLEKASGKGAHELRLRREVRDDTHGTLTVLSSFQGVPLQAFYTKDRNVSWRMTFQTSSEGSAKEFIYNEPPSVLKLTVRVLAVEYNVP